MNHKNNFLQKFSIFLFLIFFLTFVSAEVLVTVIPEKKEVFVNEVDYLVIKILNNSQKSLDKMYLRIEGSDNVVFVEDQESKVLLKELTDLTAGVTKEVKVKFKATSAKTDPSTLFVYYGYASDYESGVLPFVAGTIVNTKESNFIVTTKVERSNSSAGEGVIGEISVSNKTGVPINGFGAEMIVPTGFDLKSDPFFVESIKDSNKISTKFEALAPIQIDGEKVIVIVYGYFDANGAHYFENEHKVSFAKSNRSILALVGIIVLIVAVFLYLRQTKKDEKLKGTDGKK